MLCRMLAATGVAGVPQSYFHRPDTGDWARYLDLPCTATLTDILERVRATASDGLCGIRVQRDSFDFLMKTLNGFGTTDRQRIEAALGPSTYLWLTRDDKLAQAISLLRAEHSGLWHRNADGTELERLPPVSETGFDAQAIAAQIDRFHQADADWRAWFSENDIEPFHIRYGDLASNPTQTLSDCLHALGCDPKHATNVPVQTARLADATSEAWARKFLAIRRETD